MIKDLLVAERYARALFDLARVLHRDDQIQTELDNFSMALKNDPGLERLFNNPSLKTEEKRKFLQRLYQERREDFYETLLDFYTVLLDKDRFPLVHEIAVSFKRIADEAKGQGSAQVRSAMALTPQQEAAIVGRLEAMAGYRIAIRKEVDPLLIGGAVVQIRNKVIDGSVRRRIDELKKELSKIHGI